MNRKDSVKKALDLERKPGAGGDKDELFTEVAKLIVGGA